MAVPVALILGAGPGVGLSTARKFAAHGYRVAAVSRSAQEPIDGVTSFAVDYSKPSAVIQVFKDVKSKLGAAPSVVLFNIYSNVVGPDGPFSVPVEAFADSLEKATTTLYATIQAALEGFKTLDPTAPKSVFVTGNGLDSIIVPRLHVLGITKATAAYMLRVAAAEYPEHRFVFLDERQGSDLRLSYNGVDGPAHADVYYELATSPTAPKRVVRLFTKEGGLVDDE